VRGEGLQGDFERLRLEDDPQRRGYGLEKLLGRLFRAGHFDVKRDPKGARPRQTDLIATRGGRGFVIEAKWQQGPAGPEEVDSLRSRLARLPAGAVGVLVSIGGFSSGAREVIERERNRGVVLAIDEERLLDLLAQPAILDRSLAATEERLLVEGDLAPPDHLRSRRGQLGAVTFTAAEAEFRLPGGSGPVVVAGGDLSGVTFTRELEDIDWVTAGGYGVSFDLRVEAHDQDDLLWLLGELSEIGWATGTGQWCLSQTDVNWHGLGAVGLVAALGAWGERYTTVDRAHHTERLSYVDSVPGGFYTLIADIVADDPRRVFHVSLSFQLTGVPLDPAPYRRLALAASPGDSPYFRPRAERSVGHLWLRGEPVPLETVGTMVAREPDDDPTEDWVSGVVAKNPFYGRPDLMAPHGDLGELQLTETEILICDLGNWHPVAEPRDYGLVGIEWAGSSDVVIVRPRADWDDPPGEGGGADRPPLTRPR
jgi:hypothetical protein